MTDDFVSLSGWTRECLPAFLHRIVALPSVDSTNRLARTMIDETPWPGNAIVVADRQTHGRGRFTRRWESPAGVGLWFTLLLNTEWPRDKLFQLTFMSALAVGDAVQETLGRAPRLKWPNDVLIGDRKLCGILLETASRREANFVMVGVGLNVNQDSFPAEMRSSATSLRLECGRILSRATVLKNILDRFGEYYLRGGQRILSLWKERADCWGRSVRVRQPDRLIEGIARDLADDGALIVEVDGTLEKVYAGDVEA